jgi:uncharacterized protein involved in response to NO
MFDRVLWAYGFRPFFLLVPAWAAVALLAWAAMLAGWLPMPQHPVGWHAHEMVFGLIGAALGGFLLTAVPSWTDSAPVTGRRLAALVAVWVGGRLAVGLAGMLPAWIVAIADLPFLAWLLVLVGRPMLARADGRHRSFIPVLAGLCLANLLVHLEWLGLGDGLEPRGLALGVNLFALLIVLTIGRISPVVVAQALEETGDERRFRPNPPRQNLAAAVLALYAAAEMAMPATAITGWVALAAAAAQLDRLADWHVGRVVTRPYVAVLYAAYWWLAIGLGLIGAAHLGAPVDASAGIHAIAIGAFGSAVLAVLTIAGLRHTGRKLAVPAACSVAFALASAGAAFRAGATWLADPLVAHVAASVLLAAAFLIYLARFHRLLREVRVDGKPG